MSRASKGQNELLPLAEARANAFIADMAMKPPRAGAARRAHVSTTGTWPTCAS